MGIACCCTRQNSTLEGFKWELISNKAFYLFLISPAAPLTGQKIMKSLGRYCVTAMLLSGIFLCAARADPVAIDSDTLKGVPRTTVEQVTNFLERFIDSSRQPEEQLSLYTDDVFYFDRGQVSKAEILHDMKRYRRQWPSRNYRVSRIELIYPDPQSDSVYVRYEIEFTVFNPSNAKRIKGRGVYGAVIDDIDGTPQVASIQESVFARKRSSEADR